MKNPPDSQAGERPNMRQIATLAGVSTMTVSRSLRNSSLVKPEVRARIQELALRLGYRPDPKAAKLVRLLRRRSQPAFVASIAALTSFSAEIEPPFTRRLREHAQAHAAELGYALEVFRIGAPEKFNRGLERVLLSRGIEGILLLPMRASAHVDRLLNWTKFSVVAATPSVLAPEFPRVAANYFHNARLLCDALTRRGCTRIGFLGPESFCARTRHAFAAAAVWEGMAIGGTAVRPFVYPGWRPDGTEFSRWFAQEQPDAIIVHTERLIPYLNIASDKPIVFACTNTEPLTSKWPGINERHDLIGRKAVDVLTSLVNRGEKNVRDSHSITLIEGHWDEPGCVL